MAKESTCLKNLRLHQQWRRGMDIDRLPLEAHEVTAALDYAIAVVAAAENLVEVSGRHHTQGAYKRLVDTVKDGKP
jgi:hypothetical protein